MWYLNEEKNRTATTCCSLLSSYFRDPPPLSLSRSPLLFYLLLHAQQITLFPSPGLLLRGELFNLLSHHYVSNSFSSSFLSACYCGGGGGGRVGKVRSGPRGWQRSRRSCRCRQPSPIKARGGKEGETCQHGSRRRRRMRRRRRRSCSQSRVGLSRKTLPPHFPSLPLHSTEEERRDPF